MNSSEERWGSSDAPGIPERQTNRPVMNRVGQDRSSGWLITPMARMNRRRTLIGLGTIVFGASGFVASGAVTLGSEGSLGDNWVQVEGTNQAIDLSPVQTDTGEQGSEGGDGSIGIDPGTQNSDGGGETGGDGGGDDDDSTGGGGGGESPSTRVQVITDPNNLGNAVNTGGPVTWNGSIGGDAVIAETSDGFFQGLKDENLNRQGTTVYGTLSGGGSGYPTTPVFIIANVGPQDGGTPGTAVSVSTALYDGDTEVTTDQIRFPYRAVDASGTTFARGSDLFDSAVTLSVGDVIEVAVIFDTNGGSAEFENVDTIRFSAIGVDT
ncbi:MAG: hypothetical protein ABEH60_06830 [Halonotius sp.]